MFVESILVCSGIVFIDILVGVENQNKSKKYICMVS